jgi:cytochrome c oxidase subunit 3
MSAEAPVLHGSEPVAAHRREAGMPTPLVGMLLFIASEVMFFGGLFATYFNARATYVGEWAPPHPAPELEILPIALPITIILVASSFTMQLGVWAIRRGNQRAMRNWTMLTLVLGVAFLIGQIYDYTTLGFGISDGAFGTVFYTLTGFHGAHVFGGAVGLTILAARASQGQFSQQNHVAVEAISFYWHFVDVVWIALFSTLYFLH